MMTGVVDAANFELEGFRKAYEEQFGLLRLIVTGGDSEYFETKIKSRIFVHPDLMMIGLNEILEYNLNQS
jgi:type III pantothenate kinase